MEAATFAELGFDAWLTIGVVLLTFAGLVWERVSPAWILLGAVVVLTLAGVLTPLEAVTGFSNTAVLTVAVLFIVVGALRSTGAIRWIASWVLGKPHGVFVAQARLVSISSSLSAFINNTPVVAMLTAAVEDWSRKAKVPVSKLLIPLSYATVLGGMCSLIGTSTNLVVLGLMQQETDLPTLGMFAPAWVGVPAALVGMVYLLTVGRWLLPDRSTALDQARRTREYVLEMRVRADGKLVGKTISEAGFESIAGTYLVELQRDDVVQPLVQGDSRLQAGDRLAFVGSVEGLREVRHISGLQHIEDQVFKIGSGAGRHFVEVIPSRLSPVIGKSLRAARFRDRYGAAVVAVNRHGRQLRGAPRDIVLQAGDTLLLETTPEFTRKFKQSREFIMVNLVDDAPMVQPRRALGALAILCGLILANVVLHVDIFISATVAALAVVATRCIGLRDAWRSVDYPLVVAIACALGMGMAMTKTGVASAVAAVLLQLGGADPFWSLVMVYLLTIIFTELLTNNAAAVLMFPIGLAAALQLGVNPMPFVMTVMIGASAGFITPIGYQTHLMVYGPGGYRFMDYVRAGTPLSLLVGMVAMNVIPRVWGF